MSPLFWGLRPPVPSFRGSQPESDTDRLELPPSSPCWSGWSLGVREVGGTNSLPLPKPPEPAIPSLATRGQQRFASTTPEGPSGPRLSAPLEWLLRPRVSGLESGTPLLTLPMPPSRLPNVYLHIYVLNYFMAKKKKNTEKITQFSHPPQSVLILSSYLHMFFSFFVCFLFFFPLERFSLTNPLQNCKPPCLSLQIPQILFNFSSPQPYYFLTSFKFANLRFIGSLPTSHPSPNSPF